MLKAHWQELKHEGGGIRAMLVQHIHGTRATYLVDVEKSMIESFGGSNVFRVHSENFQGWK